MIIKRDGCGITLKHSENSVDLVRIGVTLIVSETDGVVRRISDTYKPHDDYTVKELSDLLWHHIKPQ